MMKNYGSAVIIALFSIAHDAFSITKQAPRTQTIFTQSHKYAQEAARGDKHAVKKLEMLIERSRTTYPKFPWSQLLAKARASFERSKTRSSRKTLFIEHLKKSCADVFSAFQEQETFIRAKTPALIERMRELYCAEHDFCTAGERFEEIDSDVITTVDAQKRIEAHMGKSIADIRGKMETALGVLRELIAQENDRQERDRKHEEGQHVPVTAKPARPRKQKKPKIIQSQPVMQEQPELATKETLSGIHEQAPELAATANANSAVMTEVHADSVASTESASGILNALWTELISDEIDDASAAEPIMCVPHEVHSPALAVSADVSMAESITKSVGEVAATHTSVSGE